VIITLVFLIILAFFVALFTIRARVTIEMQEELALWVTFAGIRINILPKKPKKYKISDYTPQKIAKRDKKAEEKAAKKAKKAADKKAKKAADKQRKKDEQKKLTRAERKAIKAKKKASRPPIPDMISLFSDIVKLFFSRLFGKLHVHMARIRIKVGSPDAASTAMMYVGICNALNPILALIEKHSNLHGRRRADIDISPDFLSEELKTDIKLGFSMSIGGLLGVLFKVAFRFLFGWIKIKPSAPSDRSDKNKKQESSPSPESDAKG